LIRAEGGFGKFHQKRKKGKGRLNVAAITLSIIGTENGEIVFRGRQLKRCFREGEEGGQVAPGDKTRLTQKNNPLKR